MNSLLEPLAIYLRDIGWRDGIEISLFTLTVYWLQCWLQHDKQKSLLGYWYAYCAFWLCAHLLQLTTVSHGLLILLPAAITMFVLVHQRTLQKNYISLRAITPATLQPDDWIDVVMQTALRAMNNNKSVWFIIEQHDALATFITTPLPLQATIKKELLALLLDSAKLDEEKYIWLTIHGEMLGLNAAWHKPADVTDGQQKLPGWQQDALFYTTITDAVVLYANAHNRTFTVITQGSLNENITAQNAHRFIKRHQPKLTPSSTTLGGKIHGSYRVHSSSSQQPQS